MNKEIAGAVVEDVVNDLSVIRDKIRGPISLMRNHTYCTVLSNEYGVQSSAKFIDDKTEVNEQRNRCLPLQYGYFCRYQRGKRL